MYGNYALFSDPVVRVLRRKNKLFNSNLRGIARYYGKHILETHDLWVIDEIRVMNRIQTETKGIRPIKYNGGNEPAYYTYLKDVRYQYVLILNLMSIRSTWYRIEMSENISACQKEW